MKKRFVILLAVLLLAGCTQVSPEQTTAQTTESITTPTETTLPEPTKYQFPEGAEIKIRTVADVIFTYCWQDKNELFYACLDEVTGLNVNVWLYDPDVCLYGSPDPECFIDKIKSIEKANHGGAYGSYLNLWEYRDMMPNLFAFLDSPEYAHYREIYMPDEETLYMAPIFTNGSTEHSAWLYREDIFRQLELQIPTDWDSFYKVLQALKAAYPESYPFTMSGLQDSTIPSWTDFAQQFGVDYDPKGFARGADGTFYDSRVTEEMREMLKKLRQLTEEGLMAPDWLNNDDDMCGQALVDGTSFITHTKSTRLQIIERKGQKNDGAFSLGWFNNIPLVESELPYTTRMAPVEISGWGIVSGYCPDIELAVRFLDWLYSEEGIQTTFWGIEGVTYGVREDGSKYYLESFKSDLKSRQPFIDEELSGAVDFNAILEIYTPKNKELICATVEAAKSGGFHPVSNVTFGGEKALLVDTYLQPYLDVSTEYIAKFLAGDLDINSDAHWQQMVAAIEASKQAELLEVFNAVGNAK